MHYLLALLVLYALGRAVTECPNACSAHGECGAYDMCKCYRNWMLNDCSGRVCQFGLAHVDSPKGDLDSSANSLTDSDITVVVGSEMYPYGTQEKYPNIVASGDTGTPLSDTAHYYMECSNKGLCNRATGICSCFDGYKGSACQRADCPMSNDGECSGHGICKTIGDLAADDNDNIYKLWDEKITMGCSCDAGYIGGDCSERLCKVGADPLYAENEKNVRMTNWTYQIYTEGVANVYGNYSILFYDHSGEDWETRPIDIAADCFDLVAALHDLPNFVIPSGSLRCTKDARLVGHETAGRVGSLYSTIIQNDYIYLHTKFTLAFPENLGYLKQPKLNFYLDGTRPTLYTDETDSTLGYHIYANGFTGEDTDYVNDYCSDVTVYITAKKVVSNVASDANTNTLSTIYAYRIVPTDTSTDFMLNKLKVCLGGSDADDSNNVDDYNWDKGSLANPHLIKMIVAEDEVDETTGLYKNYDMVSTLCTYAQDGVYTSVYDGKSNSLLANDGNGNTLSWCQNKEPAGFYAIIIYDGTDFRMLTRGGYDYGQTTRFNVFTTSGYLQLVRKDARAFTVGVDTTESYAAGVSRIPYMFSDTVYFAPYTQSGDDYGQHDCEYLDADSSISTMDCIEKGDLIMMLAIGKQDSNSYISTHGYAMSSSSTASDTAMTPARFLINPIYPNIYKVEKLSRENRMSSTETEANYRRFQMKLNIGTNAEYVMDTTSTADYGAAIYKFYPPAGYNYVGECSNRGICDRTNGLCTCFEGYTGDNCHVQNSLAI